MGIITPAGRGICDSIDAFRNALREIKPLHLFPAGHAPPLPVGEISSFSIPGNVPRTHALALIAAEEAMKNSEEVPDAVVVGVTTGGMPLTEELLKRGEVDPQQYSYHSTSSVAEYIARQVGCKGQVLTVSTACSSGIVALKIAFEMIRRGKARRVLAGGADALCRLTYHGFHSLQLVDPRGARPFDKSRQGMTVGEGAAMLMLSAAKVPPDNAIAKLLGVGLSCDAHHPSSPHPEGLGGLRAMGRALADAGVLVEDIDYIHLHGTGTIDNDIAEAKAICSLFGERPLPLMSSIKGSIGHSLAAAGAIGAVASALSITHRIIPANVGFNDADPGLKIVPVKAPMEADVKTVLVNSFGFGGNNAVLVLGHPETRRSAEPVPRHAEPVSFSVLGTACLTAVGNVEKTIERMCRGDELGGIVPSSDILKPLSEKAVRRLKRFPRMVLNLAISASEGNPTAGFPASVFLGTGWGGFLKHLIL